MATIRTVVESITMTTNEAAEFERELIVDYIKRMGYQWSTADIRPSRDSALSHLVGAIERGEHREAEPDVVRASMSPCTPTPPSDT